ncbi:protein deglycase HchA, partial [Staphylococcus aureus]|nr:protein deglycase HchA [Staphylococcus aureus]
PFEVYSVCVFPDSLDEGANIEIGYLPGRLKWLVADLLTKHGLKVVNDDITGRTLKDRKLLTGDSHLASKELGKLEVNEMLNSIQ